MSRNVRVTVTEEWTDEGGAEQFRTLADLAAPVGVLRIFASDTVHAVLADLAGAPGELRTLPEVPAADEVDAEWAAAGAVPQPGPERPKRKRRTKAEIAADKAHEAAARQVAEVVVSNGQAAAQVGEAADTVAEPVVAQQLAEVPGAPVVAQPSVPEYNPFLPAR